MVHQRRHSEQNSYQLVSRASSDSRSRSPSVDDEEEGTDERPSPFSNLLWLPERLRFPRYALLPGSRRPRRPRRRCRLAYWAMLGVPYILMLLVVAVSLVRPSYTHQPAHYRELEKRMMQSREPGRGNVNNEKVFIAASIYDHDGNLLGGRWGEQILELIDLLGPSNVYLSIYENDPDPRAQVALEEYRKQVKCQSSIISEHLPLSSLPRVSLPSGDAKLKRIAFLAEVRNRALKPLLSHPTANTKFDKLLFVNDVFFSPLDAVQLLFSTGQDLTTGKTTYGAACAVDFINPFKFYDRFATRDLEGHSMGVPFFPWFTDAGDAQSRHDVLEQKDAVRVRSCWGGMTAFEASWFQQDVSSKQRPYLSFREGAENAIRGGIGLNKAGALRFRYEADTYWDASECCLIHADLQYLRNGRRAKGGLQNTTSTTDDTGIYMNPYIRVAYDTGTLSWLSLTRRPEHLYAGIQKFINGLAGFPAFNNRIDEEPGDIVRERVWTYRELDREGGEDRAMLPAGVLNEDGEAEEGGIRGSENGQFREVERVVGPGRFCGGRKLLVINEHPKEGEKHWQDWPVPEDV